MIGRSTALDSGLRLPSSSLSGVIPWPVRGIENPNRSSNTLMISRYTDPQMGSIWTDQNKFQKWLEVEIATAEVEAEAGLIPKSAARAIRRKARFEVERILEIEKKVKHDVI